MKYCLTVDFGSTFTKVCAVSLVDKKILAYAKAFTTIETDVREGLNSALKELDVFCGKITYDLKLASSSAAGGLKMISCGLVPELTSKASKMAAASAGAKVLKTYAYELNANEQQEIFDLEPDIILLSGGIDGGNKEVILKNAKTIANIDRNFSVIIAGNKTVSNDVFDILNNSGKQAIICENVMPEFNKLNIAPAKSKIRDLFIENIIDAKGLDLAQKMLSDTIIPTPLAVFEAAEIFSYGTKTEEGIGELMAYDVGGATTDVYSMSDGIPTKNNVVLKSFREPYAKRTVEGDIGVRYSIGSLIEEAGASNIAQNLNLPEEEIISWMNTCKKSPEIIPEKSSNNKRIDQELAALAVSISANRHCGSFETAYTPFGETIIQTGKDLTNIKYIIGGGGSIVHSDDPKYILSKALYDMDHYDILKPRAAKFLLDKKSVFAAMGLVARIKPDIAIQIMKNEFVEI